MTREEAKRRLLDIERCTPIHTREDARDFEALEMAIQALSQEQISLNDINNALGASFRNGVRSTKVEQEPCEDAISRAEVKRIVDFYKEQYDGIYHINESIDALPSVEPCNKPTHYGDSTEKCKSCEYKRNTCDDAISRDAVLSIIDGWYEQNRETENIEDLIILITYMDSVTQKSGKWIEKDGWDGDVYYECSVCEEPFCLIDGTPTDNMYNYCPNCGAKMVEPQGRSRK